MLIILPPARTDAQWKQTSGPGGGPVTALAQKGDTLYAGTNSGIYLSLDSGFNWSLRGLTNMLVTFIFVKDDFLFAATSGSGVYRSTNGGATWVDADSVLPLAIPTSMISKGNYLFVSFKDSQPYNRSGVFRSSDNGNTWIHLASTSNYIYYNALAVKDDTIYVAADGLYKSGNNGDTWTKLDVALYTSVICFAFLDSNIYVGVDYTKGIFKSSDYGKSWDLILSTSEVTVTSIATNGRIILAGTNGDNLFGAGLYRSDDKGKT